MSTNDAVAFWDDVYAGRPAAEGPRPNARLTETVTGLGLPPGEALDLGCGEGGDALWLAGQGWRVTAVDISAVAVERLTALARAQALGDRVLAARHDVQESFPPGEFDLVCAHYLHTPSVWTGRPSCDRPLMRCGPAGGCWWSITDRPRRGRGTGIPAFGTRARRRSPPESI